MIIGMDVKEYWASIGDVVRDHFIDHDILTKKEFREIQDNVYKRRVSDEIKGFKKDL